MIIKLDIKPLSVNQVWRGRRFKTPEYKQYEKDVSLLLCSQRLLYKNSSLKEDNKYYFEVSYIFYLRNFHCFDIDNCIKPLQDILVKNGIIPDDRRIVKFTAQKIPSKIDRIEIGIKVIEDLQKEGI